MLEQVRYIGISILDILDNWPFFDMHDKIGEIVLPNNLSKQAGQQAKASTLLLAAKQLGVI
jgi:hypothetical protein